MIIAPDAQAWNELHGKLLSQGFTGNLTDTQDLWLRAGSDSTVRFQMSCIKHMCGNKAMLAYVGNLIQSCRRRGLYGADCPSYLYNTDVQAFTMFSGRRSPDTGAVRVSSVTIEVRKVDNGSIVVAVEAYRNSDSCKLIKRTFTRSGRV